MQTIEIKEGVHVSLSKILQGIKKLDAETLDKFAREVSSLAAGKKAQPAEREAELLKKIKSAIPASTRRRKNQLYTKMQDGVITEKEHKELLLILDIMENQTALRIHLMGELAQLRGVSVTELAKQLNLK